MREKIILANPGPLQGELKVVVVTLKCKLRETSCVVLNVERECRN
jgi:hypothetical protein